MSVFNKHYTPLSILRIDRIEPVSKFHLKKNFQALIFFYINNEISIPDCLDNSPKFCFFVTLLFPLR